MMVSKNQLKAIWAIAGAQGLDEDSLRDLVEDETGQRSISSLSMAQASSVIERLKGGSNKRRYADCDGRKGMATGKQLRKIEAMWMDHSREKTGQSLRAWLSNKFKVSDPRFLSRSLASEAIVALENF